MKPCFKLIAIHCGLSSDNHYEYNSVLSTIEISLMKLNGSRVTRTLGIRYPLIQAPMSWITDAKLVAAVSEAGGLGVFGPGAGYNEPALDPRDDGERLRAQIREARKLTRKPIGVNILLMGTGDDPLGEFSAAWLKVAFEEGIRHFVTVGQANADVFNNIIKHDGIIIHRPLTPSVENMCEAEALGADILVATGYDEGGYIPEQAWGTFTVVPAMADAVSVPVLAAGGINDSRGVMAAFALGAEGVFIGTRFIATQESPAAQVTKDAIVSSGYKNIVFASALQRSIRTRTADRLAGMLEDPTVDINLDAEISRLGGCRPAMLQGKIDEGIISVNTGIDVIRDIPSVSHLIQKLMEPVEQI